MSIFKTKRDIRAECLKKGEIIVKECWELFSVPKITDTGYGKADENTINLQFCCEKTNTSMNIYYQKDENIDSETLSKIIKTVLSVCLHCTGKKPLCDNGYIVH